MVWYNKSTVTGVRTAIVTLYRRCSFISQSFMQGREITASHKPHAGLDLTVSGKFTVSSGQI